MLLIRQRRDGNDFPTRAGEWLGRLSLLGLAALLLAVVGCAWSWSIWQSPAFGLLADQGYHLALAVEYDQAWRAGEFPPRWAAGMNGGRGGPVFVVYPPFFAWLTASLARLAPAREALAAALLLTAFATFWAVYYLARAWLPPHRSLLGGAVVLLLPGTTLIGLGRGMYPNFAALLWVALAAGAAQRVVLGQRARSNTALLAGALAGLLLTHTLTAFLVAMTSFAALPLIWRRVPRRALWGILGGGVGAMLITAWYWLPLLEAGNYLRIEYLETSHAYRESTLWGSAPETTAYEKDWALLNLVGKSVVVAQSLLALSLWWTLRRSYDASRNLRVSSEPQAGDSVLFLELLPLVAAFCFVVSLDPIAALLVELPRFGTVQFAWRWQLLVALWCGVAVASLPRRALSLAPAAATVVVLFFFSPLLSRAGTRPEEVAADLPAKISRGLLDSVTPITRAAYRANSLELRPRGSDSFYYLPAPFGRVELVSGAATVEPQTLRPSFREYQVIASAPSTLRIVTYHCPGWTAKLDGAPLEIKAESGTGVQLVDVPAGSHRLELKYEVAW